MKIPKEGASQTPKTVYGTLQILYNKSTSQST